MKAVILAGGEGTRLRPLTLERPKPMVPLFGRPVLEHILLLLRKNGFDQVALSLRYLPQVIQDYFGDGSAWGMELHYFVEQDPLGTAGGVKAAEEFIGDEDFLVFSGDCVCDFDLRECCARHKARKAAVTLLLHRERDPLEYGLVQLDQDNRVERFLEKPGWGEVFTNLVNTGIYFLSPAVLKQIPADTAYDFSRELFPKLLEKGTPLYGDTPYGYWRDMGDTGAYLQAAADALDGKVKLDLLLPQLRAGVWCASPLPESCAVVPPCWIAERVTIGESCLIGPHTVLEQGTFLGDRTVAQRSVLLGCAVGTSSTLHGAILCEDSSVGSGCTLAQGSVLGAEAVLEDHVMLREEVRIWPRIPVKSGSRLTSSVTGGALPIHVCFEGGAIRGRLAQEITPELLLTLGSVLGRWDRVALGATPGTGGAALLMAAAAGVSAAGSIPLVHDGTTWGAGAYFARQGGADCSLFIECQGEECLLWTFDCHGLPLDRDQSRRIEGALRRQEIHRASAGAMGRQEQAKGVDTAYCTAAVQQAGTGAMPALTLCVPEEGRENQLLIQALQGMGCKVLRQRRRGVPALWCRRGGRLLFAEDERGGALLPEHLLLMALLALVEAGETRLALPWDTPAAAFTLLRELGAAPAPIEEGAALAQAQAALRDGIFAACLLCRRIGRTGESLGELNRRIPAFGVFRGELPLEGSRGDLMEQLARRWPEADPAREGLRLHLAGGWAWLHPAASQAVLKVRTEGENVELAAELCDLVLSEARRLDRKKPQN